MHSKLQVTDDVLRYIKVANTPQEMECVSLQLWGAIVTSLFGVLVRSFFTVYVMFQHSQVQLLVMISFVLQDSRSPLYTASCNRHLDVVKTLIETGANVNQANKVQCVGIL